MFIPATSSASTLSLIIRDIRDLRSDTESKIPPVYLDSLTEPLDNSLKQLDKAESAFATGNEDEAVEQVKNARASIKDYRQALNTRRTQLSSGNFAPLLVKADAILEQLQGNVDVPANAAPTANAGSDQNAELGSVVKLDGGESTDPEGDSLSYFWTVISAPEGSAVGLSDPTVVSPTLLPDLAGNYSLQLIVNDRWVDSAPDTMEIIVDATGVPSIGGFSPDTATIGTLVTISGENFSISELAPVVILLDQDSGSVTAPIASFNDSTITFTVPPSAATGLLKVQVGDDIATSLDPLTILASSDFLLSAAPPSVDLIQGKTAHFALTLETENNFPQLASVDITGLPPGIDASVRPSQIAVGQTALLTLTAENDYPAEVIGFQVSAHAVVDGIDVMDALELSLNVLPVSTSFMGRTVVADPLQTPLAGVAVTMLGVDGNGVPTGCSGETLSDAAGNFAFTNLPDACIGPQLIRYDGSTVTSPEGDYAGVDLFYDLAADLVTESPVLIHLPRIDNAETVMVIQNHFEDQHFTFETIPDLEVTIYAGTTFRLLDGSRPDPFPLVAIEVPIDRLPDQMPPNDTSVDPFIVAFQPANATSSQPVAVFFPNRLNTPPTTPVSLMTLDPTQGVMVEYGTALVADNGTQIVPDFDPLHPGHRYGLVHFDWHGPSTPPNPTDPPPPPDPPCANPPCSCESGNGPTPSAGDPVDLSSGLIVLRNTDIAIRGGRGSLQMTRTYRTLSNQPGPFGIGTNHEYGYRLDTNSPQSANLINLISPNGSQLPFSRRDENTFINTTVPSLQGAIMTVAENGTTTLKWKTCAEFTFEPSTFPLGSVLQSIKDENGNTTLMVRDPLNPARITEVIDPVRRKLLLNYDSQNRITRITDPIGRTVNYTYNTLGMLASVTNPEGGITRYQYDSQRRLASITDPRGNVVAQNTYDDNGRVIEQVQADGGVISFDYQLANSLVPSSPVLITTVTDPLGNQTVYRFSPVGFLINVTDPLGKTLVYEREPGTNLVIARHGTGVCDSCDDISGGDVRYTRDANGNILTVEDAEGNILRYTYDPKFNKPLTITDPLGGVVSFGYDERGNLTSLTDQNRNQTSFTYDEFGLLQEITDALGGTSKFTYDVLGNLVTITDPLGHKILFRYDTAGRQIQVTDSLGHKTEMTYDKLNLITEITDANGNSIRFSYDKNGNIITITDAIKITTQFEYDEMNRVVQRIDPLGKSNYRAYDLNGNLIVFTDRKGQERRYNYDEINRLVENFYTDGDKVERFFDPRGRLVQAKDSIGGRISFQYDNLGRLIQSRAPQGAIIYSHDALGRALSRQVVGQEVVSYIYDPAGNLLSASQTSATIEFAYDVLNRLTKVSRSNGATSRYAYDAISQLNSLQHSIGSNILNFHTYTYDANGNRISYGTTADNLLLTKSSIRKYDIANKLLQSDEITFDYDENGNRVTQKSASEYTIFHWDARNNLTKIENNKNSEENIIEFEYDSFGNMVKNKTSTEDEETSNSMLIDKWNNVVYVTNNKGSQTSILTAPVIDSYFIEIDSANEQTHNFTDGLNSTAITTNTHGDVKKVFNYDPHGLSNNETNLVSFRYKGRIPVHGHIYYYRSRFYDSMTGSFISEDPLGVASGDTNLYKYSNNNPLLFTDTLGLTTNDSGVTMRDITYGHPIFEVDLNFEYGAITPYGDIIFYPDLRINTGYSTGPIGVSCDSTGKCSAGLSFGVRGLAQAGLSCSSSSNEIGTININFGSFDTSATFRVGQGAARIYQYLEQQIIKEIMRGFPN